MSDIKIMLSCKNVSIRYRVGDFKNIGLKEWLMRRITGKYKVIDFWADKDISFELHEGDMLGIIGTNGAGKSTLLKAVTGIMEPTKGRIARSGKVSALLELASGFDGDLTVKENAYLRGAMLGYTRKFMDETYPYIIEFSDKVVDECKWIAPYALLMEVTGYTPWLLAERMKIRNAVKEMNPECKIVLIVDENVEKDAAKQVKQAKKDGLIDQFIYGSISATYLADIIDSL